MFLRWLISHPKAVRDEEKLAAKWLENPSAFLLLRKPDWSVAQVLAFIKKLPANRLAQVAVAQHYRECLKAGCGYAHILGPEKITPAFMALPGKKCVVARSFDELLTIPVTIDVAFLFPCFEHTTREGVAFFFDEKLVAQHLAGPNPRPLCVAAGGITPDRTQFCSEMGFEGVAYMEYFWNLLSESGPEAASELVQSIFAQTR